MNARFGVQRKIAERKGDFESGEMVREEWGNTA